ncbi:MAG TPA: 4Fe-4S binding protein, partial [Usitatibacteraceae bacterium]|nr:4Fe-4S binding protein [Usitatibacteraceae bacterium]
MAALSALAPFEPVARVDYVSQGRLLVVADDAMRARQAVADLRASLSCAVLWCGSGTLQVELADVVAGQLVSLRGHLGAFELVFRSAPGAEQVAPFDLVLDLRPVPAFQMADRPQGYYHAAFNADYAVAVQELPQMVGEFEKPKFFAYRESICAHSRSKKDGCNRCIEVCSTGAIRAAGDHVEIDAHLCMGCGGCATVCPSGAMSYQYPRVADRGV